MTHCTCNKEELTWTGVFCQHLTISSLHSGANYSFHKEKAKPAEPIAPVVSACAYYTVANYISIRDVFSIRHLCYLISLFHYYFFYQLTCLWNKTPDKILQMNFESVVFPSGFCIPEGKDSKGNWCSATRSVLVSVWGKIATDCLYTRLQFMIA